MASCRQVFLAVFLLFVALSGIATAGVVPGYEYVPGEIIIKFHENVSSQGKESLLVPVGGQKLRNFDGIKAEQWRVSTDVEAAIAELENDPRVAYAQPNYIVHIIGIPDDTRFSDLWGMHNTGQTGGTVDADIDAVEAWDVFTGSSDVLVAVIDSGVDYNHPDLVDNAWTNPGEIAGNGLDDDNNGFVDDMHGYDFYNDDADPMDDNGHGSHCSGTIGGTGNNGLGVTGVSWDVSIMGLKFLSAGGTGNTADAIACVEYATAQGVDIMSNSWGGGPYDAALEAAIEAAYQAGIFFVAAAGNSGTDNDSGAHYPSNYEVPNVISVMATDHTDVRVNEPGWWASNYGLTSVDIAAPGLHIWSTTPGSNYSDYSGTSMATPHVAGALALLRGRFPNIGVDDGINLLMTVGNDPLASLDGLCVSGSRLNVLKLIGDPDETPPSAVTDLAAGAIASNWAEVVWTAPGDDGPVGTSSSYDMRWSLTPITDELSWDAANMATGEPDPGVYGTPESMQVNGLDVSTDYYFSVRAKDEYGNLGGLSNSAMVTTLGPPSIGIAPLSLAATLETGGTTTEIVTITNTGEGVLDFSIPTAEYIIPAKGSFAPVRSWDYDTQAKGANPDIKPIVGVTGSGGPDAFGYNWSDSDAAGGPSFNWIEINALGASLSLSDDVNSGPYAIGFPFSFYDTDYTEFNICSNGWVSFTDTDNAMSNGPLPATSAPVNMLALFWDDLNPSTGGNIYYYNDGARLIIEFENINHYDSGGTYSMQAHLYPNGIIEYHYLTIVDPSNSGTIGIQNSDGTDGLTVAYNAAYVHDNLAVRFASVTPWLSTSPNSGSLAAGASVDVDVTFSASNLCGSSFDANLHVLSNDALNSDAIVTANLSLTGTPDITPDLASLDFGSVYITAQSTMNLMVTNNGCADLNISGIIIDHPDYATSATAPQVVTAGASLAVPVTFTPSTAGLIRDRLVLISDDPDSPSITINVSGTGLDFPDIVVAPTSLTETLPTGGSSTQALTITNNGLGNLDFTIPEAEYIFTEAKGALPNKHAQPIELAKGEPDPRIGGPVVMGSGGPDLFGYRWSDSDELGGPTYNWIDISGVGTAIDFTGDDQNRGPHAIGFTFPFYGEAFTEFQASTNGWLSFTSTSTAYTNYDLPSSSAPENLLAVYHDDLTFTSSGTAYYHFDGTRLVVQYQAVPRLTSGGPYTFQAHLYPSGRIEYHYKTMSGTRLDEATIGIQNGTMTDGLAVAFNTNYVHDGLAVRFQSVDPWLSVDTNAGTVAPGSSLDVTVGFTATGLCADQALANLHVLSNDPDTPDVTVPVTLNLDGQPDAMLSATDLDLGSAYVAQTVSLPLSLANAGCGVLDVTELTIDNALFTVDVTAPFSVAVGATAELSLSFTPTAAGAEAGVLTITTNDPTNAVHTVNLSGTGLNAGNVAVNPTDIVQIVGPNETATQTMTISNAGQGELNFTIPSPSLYTKLMTEMDPVIREDFVERSKDAKDEEFGVTPLGSGGPDLYGYKWSDSDELGGPVFNWIDISETGTAAMTGGDDSNLGPFPIGFPFEFYGGTFTDFRVCSNGFISFTSTLTAYSNAALPSTSGPKNMIAPFWDDLNLSAAGSGDIYYQVVDGNLVVMYDAVMPYSAGNSGTGPFTFEVILEPSGRITMQYLTVPGAPASCTVGIQDATGSTALQIAYNAAYLHDGLAVLIRTPLDWLSVSPLVGTVPAGGSVDVEVAFNANELAVGSHTGMIEVLSDDPVTPSVQVGVTLEVSDLSAAGDEVLPRVTAMQQNVPNPFNPMTLIKFSLPRTGQVDLRVYDVRGALVRTLAAGEIAAGNHSRVWMGRNDDDQPVPSGVYFYRLLVEDEVITKRMTLVK